MSFYYGLLAQKGPYRDLPIDSFRESHISRGVDTPGTQNVPYGDPQPLIVDSLVQQTPPLAAPPGPTTDTAAQDAAKKAIADAAAAEALKAKSLDTTGQEAKGTVNKVLSAAEQKALADKAKADAQNAMTTGSATDDADKKALLDKQSKGTLTTTDQDQLDTLNAESNLKSSGLAPGSTQWYAALIAEKKKIKDARTAQTTRNNLVSATKNPTNTFEKDYVTRQAQLAALQKIRGGSMDPALAAIKNYQEQKSVVTNPTKKALNPNGIVNSSSIFGYQQNQQLSTALQQNAGATYTPGQKSSLYQQTYHANY